VLAYILAKVEAGKDRDVVYEIKKLKDVKSIHATYGTYDLIIEVEFKDVNGLDEFVFDKVRKMPGVKATVTVIASKTLV
jgi:DNA-binding Lrp family transcriptional regulator